MVVPLVNASNYDIEIRLTSIGIKTAQYILENFSFARSIPTPAAPNSRTDTTAAAH